MVLDLTKQQYLISAFSLLKASEIARSFNIPRQCWAYIPERYSNRREEALRGRYVSDKQFLIGYFSDDEKRRILRGENGETDTGSSSGSCR